MRKNRKFCWAVVSALIIGGIVVTFLSIRIMDMREFTQEVESSDPIQKHFADDKLTIGLIGDSWVYGTQLGPFIEKSLNAMGHNAEVISSGHPGATSKQIYQDLFLPESEATSSKKILLNENIKYCVVVAGINDSASYLGADYYAYHMCAISKSLLNHGITLVILELPEYGIEFLKPLSFRHAVKLFLFRYLFNKGEINVIKIYREELLNELKKQNLHDRVIIVDYDGVATDFSEKKYLYEDLLHINDDGRLLLAKLISQSIFKSEGR
jgi:lysophospholipase L1-like esterase